MDKIQLNSVIRDLKATTPAKLRKAGKLPAVLYGHNLKNQNLSVEAAEFEKVLKKAGESTIVDLVTDDGKTHPVLIHDIQFHYLTSKPQHVDFYEVSMTEKLQAAVALEFTGESKAVKELGGVLVKVLNEITVECLPADLPHSITVDISKLATFHDAITVKDLPVSGKVRIVTHGEEVVAKVQPPRDVEADLSQAPVEDVSAVEGAAETKPAAEGADTAKAEDTKKA